MAVDYNVQEGDGQMLEVLNRPINDRFFDLVSNSNSTIRLCAPYVKNEVINSIYSLKKETVNVEYISNFSLPDFYKKSSDIKAFETIMNKNDKIFNCQILHAKIYIFDDKKTIITSANLTPSGFKRNIEYGVFIDEPELVNSTIVDFESICNNERTGKINSTNIKAIQNILNKLPAYYEPRMDFLYSTDEIDEVIEVDKEIIAGSLSVWKRTMFTVVDSIENIEFSLTDIYEKEYVFSEKFPNNHTVKDSMRRNLQELRDLGLIKFLGNGKYKKLWK